MSLEPLQSLRTLTGARKQCSALLNYRTAAMSNATLVPAVASFFSHKLPILAALRYTQPMVLRGLREQKSCVKLDGTWKNIYFIFRSLLLVGQRIEVDGSCKGSAACAAGACAFFMRAREPRSRYAERAEKNERLYTGAKATHTVTKQECFAAIQIGLSVVT